MPCGPIYSIDQVFADPQVQHLGMRSGEEQTLGDTQLVNSAVNVERHQEEDPQRDAGSRRAHQRDTDFDRLQRRRFVKLKAKGAI